MGLYSFSSQFTEFVESRSANPQKVRDQVLKAIENLNDLGFPMPSNVSMITSFHDDLELTDEELADSLSDMSEREKISLINSMYLFLGSLKANEYIDKNAIKLIRSFLAQWEPLKSKEQESSPMVVRNRPSKGTRTAPEIRDPLEGRGDRETEALRRMRLASIKPMLVLAGVLEIAPSFNSRKQRLLDRRMKWAKLFR